MEVVYATRGKMKDRLNPPRQSWETVEYTDSSELPDVENLKAVDKSFLPRPEELVFKELEGKIDSKMNSIADTSKSTQLKEEEQWSESALELQQKLFAAMKNQPFPGDEPFLGDITLDEYLTLNDEEQALIWDNETTLDIMDLEEKDIPAHALPPR